MSFELFKKPVKMKIFKLNTDVIDHVIGVLQDAEEFIRIAVFQLHNKKIFDALNKKLKDGVRVEIFTLPYDSINEDIRAEVTKLFQDLEGNGAKLYFCKWNVGDPERTTTAVGRWYLFHAKFIVTDKSAVALSANLIQNQELDALIIYKGEKDKINEYNAKFEELITLFIRDSSGYDGVIRQKIMDTDLPDVSSVFKLPRVIETNTHAKHWIQHYPSSLSPLNVPIEGKLYLTPFDCRGRDFIMSLISKTSHFAYLSTESFTDRDFPEFLTKMSLKGLDLRILTGPTSMDFSDRMQKMLRQLLAHNVKIRTIEGDIHAKLVITDKHLAVTSMNLNKINLGFKKTKSGEQYWRENTESIAICTDEQILATAKNQYLDIFNNSTDIKVKLAEKIEDLVTSTFFSLFGLRSKKEVKKLFSQVILREEIQVEKFVLTIGRITAKLMRYFEKNMVEKQDFFLSLILYYLSERKHDFDQLNEKTSALDTEVDLGVLLNFLVRHDFVEKVGEFYKVKIDKLFK